MKISVERGGPVKISYSATEMGWLRRSERDQLGHTWVWEKPDGTLYAHPDSDEPEIVVNKNL